jgi:hypothetical protein
MNGAGRIDPIIRSLVCIAGAQEEGGLQKDHNKRAAGYWSAKTQNLKPQIPNPAFRNPNPKLA